MDSYSVILWIGLGTPVLAASLAIIAVFFGTAKRD